MSGRIVGIDCGASGAIAVLRESECVGLFDMPMIQVGTRMEYNARAMAKLVIDDLELGASDLVAIEHVHPNGKNGAVGAFKFATGYGIWLGIIAACDLRLERVTPQRWRKAMLEGLPKGKGASFQRALELFPDQASFLTRKKDDGRAEALLIAEYARRTFAGKEGT